MATRLVVDLSSSPPETGYQSDAGYQSDTGYQTDPDLPRRSPVTDRVPSDLSRPPNNRRLPLKFGIGIRKSASPRPVHTSDTEGDFIRTTGDMPSSDSVDSEDDADSMHLDALSDSSVRDIDDYDQEDDEDELGETSAPEQDEDMGSMDDDISEDGEIIADDGDSSMSQSQNDDGRLFKLSTWIPC